MASTSFKDYYKSDMIVTGIVHVGANIGQEYSSYKSLNVPIVFFEPIPKYCDHIRNNVIDENVTVHECAIGANTHTVTLYIASNEGNSSSILKTTKLLEDRHHIDFKTSITVQQYPLDTFASCEPCNFLIIDTQGYELNVLRGAENTLKHIDYIIVEVYDDVLYEGCALFAEVNDFLISRDFVLIKKDMTWANWGNAFYKRGTNNNG